MADASKLLPQEIERRSFEIIAKCVNLKTFPKLARPVVARVVHATGDLRIARFLRFHKLALETAQTAIRSGARIITDVNMVKAGISGALLKTHGNRVYCAIHHADVAALATALKTTRAAAAMHKCRNLIRGAIVVVGNAPTALFAVLALVKAGVRPALIVGVPVGFVGAAESKEALEQCDVPYITLLGTRGGSSVAVAVTNALLNLAADD